MANLVFPQLNSGALAQYPIRKTHSVRTVKNLLTDGSMILYPDAQGAMKHWQLEYIELSETDLEALQTLFAGCVGSYRAFTFIDPTDNMLAASGNLSNPVWGMPASMQVTGGQADPFAGASAFALVNNGQMEQQFGQTLPVPASYQYCLSVYVRSSQGGSITLSLAGSSSSSSEVFAAQNSWQRVMISSRLVDPGPNVTASIRVAAGQSVEIYGPQLEAQQAPSRYRVTGLQGGVYTNAHWAVDHLPVIATAPGQFSTTFSIEASV